MVSRWSAVEEPLPYDEEFLYHLSRGSEFLIANRVGEAKEELERALVFQPRDAKGQDLLAGVYFRLGVYPRAIELWSALVEQHPEDVPLRVNLGLAFLKTAQLEEAVLHLTRATGLDEGHARAWGYLGLALWREGRLDRAREAFLRGGQASMARRMEEMLSLSGPGHPAPSLSVPPPADGHPPARRSASLAPPPWPQARVGNALERDAAEDCIAVGRGLEGALARWAPRVLGDASFDVTDGGTLLIAPRRGEVRALRERVLLLRATAAGASALHVSVAAGEQALLAPADGDAIHIVSLGEGESLYVIERHLLAYEADGGAEARTIEAGSTHLRVVAVRGRARLALGSPRRPIAAATKGQAVCVLASRLVGWSGHLFPSGSGEMLMLQGEGVVIVA